MVVHGDNDQFQVLPETEALPKVAVECITTNHVAPLTVVFLNHFSVAIHADHHRALACCNCLIGARPDPSHPEDDDARVPEINDGIIA